jgi:hypothetical protein
MGSIRKLLASAMLITFAQSVLAVEWKPPKNIEMKESLIATPKIVTLSKIDLTQSEPVSCPGGYGIVKLRHGQPEITLTIYDRSYAGKPEFRVDGACGGNIGVQRITLKFNLGPMNYELEIGSDSSAVRLYKGEGLEPVGVGTVLDYY